MTHIDRYISSVRASAGVPLDAEAEEEMRSHLEDAAHALQMAGLSPYESAREAIRRFGPSDDIARLFVQERRERRDRRARRSRSFAAALVVAASLAALGTGAVAAARAPQGATARQHRVHAVRADLTVAPAPDRATLEDHR